MKGTHPHRSVSGWSVDSTISSSKIRSSPPNTDISRQSAAPRVPAKRISRSRRPSSRLRKDDGCPAALSPSVSSRYRSHSFLAHSGSRFLSRPAVRPFRRFVRPLARSLAPSLVARPRTRLRGGGGAQTTRVLSNASPLAARYTYIRDTRHFRLTPCLATFPFSSLHRQTPATRTEDSSTGQPHAPRGAHTQRPNAFVMAIFGGKQLRAPTARRGSLRRPASGTSLCASRTGASLSTMGVGHFFFLLTRGTRRRTTPRTCVSPVNVICTPRRRRRRRRLARSREVALV